MATEAGEAAGGEFAARVAAFVELQIETLMGEGPQPTALAAGRVGAALRTLLAAKTEWTAAASKAAHPTPADTEGDEDDDAFEPPRDDAEGLELDRIILRGLDRIAARRRPALPDLGRGEDGQAGDGAAGLDRAPRPADTS